MTKVGRARAMRADGKSFAQIKDALGISLQYAYKCASDVTVAARGGRNTVVRMAAHNGGCSTLSGLVPITMPRITALHGAA